MLKYDPNYIPILQPALWKVMKSPTGNAFLHTVILTAWTSFMFGYHVHEKAILNVIIPFSIIAHDKPKQYFLTLVAGTVSLFPLLFTPFEVVFKAMISVFHFSLCSAILLPSLRWFELAYVLGFIPVYLFENLSQLIFPQLPFLPLIVLSDYCLLGLAYSYFINYWEFIISSDTKTSRSTQPSTPNRKPVSPTTPMTLRKRK
jgi:alpha-1,3-glucosyltransferase